MEQRPERYSADKYRRLANNPFVNKKMLKFIREHSTQPQEQTTGNSALLRHVSNPPVISDAAAKLIATAIKGLLRE